MMIHSVHCDNPGLSYCASLSNKVELSIAFSVGSKKTYICANKMASKMGDEQTRAQTIHHAFTRCATDSSFGGKGN